ncbi:hypothetical protein EC973_003276 [Apophysomyces ossiformis]|uniref:SH3 domain-containing protein n=1 Tax=Apophysomyces ossiformis TaxID=679940 RepID=A0A8H7BZG7_9FUNG|nr:hypothetical protein EC973_003276 [Apophysomyces ossiformis]
MTTEQALWHRSYGENEGDEEDEEYLVEDTTSMSSSPSIPDENINFNLCYVLHTFVATVEGQASVVKGDALILMEDTNIYWWLVEVLKTREIGYIPAENIETPYERLARLNKHRNVEITSPTSEIAFSETKLSQANKRVTIASGENAVHVFHYEIESDDEDFYDDDEPYEYYEHSDGDRDDVDRCENTRPELETIQEHADLEARSSYESEQVVPVQDLEELRVFGGNIGKGPLFHTFAVSTSTTADELVREAVARFGIHEFTDTEDCTIEHFLAVQGLDGDDYVLAPLDKPLSIFKTLTASLTTPMPSVTHIKRISQQSIDEKPTRRPRSSSFSNYEQTSYDEDSVIRFYLHRRIKRAHEREGLVYIKVSLYPDDAELEQKQQQTSNKKKKLRTEIDRMDKIISVRQELPIGTVIKMALEKFHVPDADAADYGDQQAGRPITKYRMSVRANGTETDLQSNEVLANVLQSTTGPVTNDLLFILRRADIENQNKQKLLVGGREPETPVGLTVNLPNEQRRPSILDILMDSPRSDERRPSLLNVQGAGDERRLSYSSQEGKSSLKTPSVQGANNVSINSTQGQPQAVSLAAPKSPSNTLSSPSPLRRVSLVNSLCLEPEETNMMQQPNPPQPSASTERKKESSFKQQLKRLVGWGNKSKKAPTSTGSCQALQTASDFPISNVSSISISPSFSGRPDTQSGISTASAPVTPMPLATANTPASGHGRFLEAPQAGVRRASAPNVSSAPPKPEPARRLSVATSISSSSSSSISDDSELDDGKPVENINISDDDSDDLEEEANEVIIDSGSQNNSNSNPGTFEKKATVAEPLLSDIQEQYAMWIDSQKTTDAPQNQSARNSTQSSKNDQIDLERNVSSTTTDTLSTPPVENTISSSPSSASTTSSYTTTSSPSSVASLWHNSKPTETSASEQATQQQKEREPEQTTADTASTPSVNQTATVEAPAEMDDLYLLVAHGVDFLKSRESSKWEEEGGYQFHPWNRPEGSFAVRKKQEAPANNKADGSTASEQQRAERRIQDGLAALLSPPIADTIADTPISPPLTPVSRQQTQEEKKPVAKTEALVPQRSFTTSSKQEAIADDELQRIVAAHIVF